MLSRLRPHEIHFCPGSVIAWLPLQLLLGGLEAWEVFDGYAAILVSPVSQCMITASDISITGSNFGGQVKVAPRASEVRLGAELLRAQNVLDCTRLGHQETRF